MSYVDSMISKYSNKGILVDTNLLLLLITGLFDKNYIQQFKRTDKYSIEDFEVVSEIILKFSSIIITPHILAELSNLSSQMKNLEKSFIQVIEIIKNSQEVYIQKDDLLSHDKFILKFGFTDISILEGALKYKLLVFTDDANLNSILQHKGVDTINLNYIRTVKWLQN